jgi:glycosyltransferase involved in cell wall biosynthesis
MTGAGGKRIVLVTNELRGFSPVGGLGTATTYLALALGRLGHRVEILFYGSQPAEAIDPEWAEAYAGAGVLVSQPPPAAEEIEPSHFVRMRRVERALGADPPDVVVTQDIGAPAYAALRLRRLGLAFESTLFVVYCHGTRRWVTDMSRQLRVKSTTDLLDVSVLEQASLELADVVVSPSAYLVDWMGEQGWVLPERTLCIPYVTRSGATGKQAAHSPRAGETDLRRLVFFGRLEQKKGVRLFVQGLNRLEAGLLAGVEVEFLGRPTPAWPPARVEAALAEGTREALDGVWFASDLDQRQALERLARPGTLAFMPSLGDNSPNTVYECLEREIPFVAGAAGGIPELVHSDDRARVLFDPTVEGMEQALRRSLTNAADALRPARAAFDDGRSLERWQRILALSPRPPDVTAASPAVDCVVVSRSGDGPILAALERQRYRGLRPIAASTRKAGLERARAEWVLFLDEEDEPDPELVETLVRAQAASEADVVGCALRLREGERTRLWFFPGQPRGLGVLGNGYGRPALIRRSLLAGRVLEGTFTDPDWPLFAELSASEAEIVSVPVPLVTTRVRPGSVERNAEESLAVLEALERVLPDHLRSLARLAAGLAVRRGPETTGSANGLARRVRTALRRRVARKT